MSSLDYLEMYPIYMTLINDISKNIGRNIKYISLGNGSALGRIVYSEDCSKLEIDYVLQKGKYARALIKKIKDIYNMYNFEIETQLVEDIVINKINKSIVIKVKIPCEFNKKCYLELDEKAKQELIFEADCNIKNRIVSLDEDKQKRLVK